MMRGIQSFLLMICMAVNAFAYDFKVDGICYIVSSDGLSVWVTKDDTDYNNKYSGDIVIPASVSYNGIDYDVIGIYVGAFIRCVDLTSVSIPNSVICISNQAFQECKSLVSIEIPNGVTSIEECTFLGCESLRSVNIPNGVSSIGGSAFQGCVSLTSIDIPSSVTEIYSTSFDDCFSLESISVDVGNSVYDSRENCNAIIETATKTLVAGCANTSIPSSVTCIGDDAFCGSRLSSIFIPVHITSIGRAAFSDCREVETIVVEEGHAVYDSRDNCNAIIETSTNTIIAACSNTIIPDDVAVIGKNAFSGCIGLTSIDIPASVTKIDELAFMNCNGLESVTIPDGTALAGYNTFAYCSNLRSVRFESKTPIKMGLTVDWAAIDWSDPLVLTFVGSENLEVFYVPDGTAEAYKSAWGDKYEYDWNSSTKTINYVEFGQLPEVENTDGGNAIVIDVNEDRVTLSIRFYDGFKLGRIIVNGEVVYPFANKVGKGVSVSELGNGKYLVTGVANTDRIEVVYAEVDVIPTEMESIVVDGQVGKSIYNLQGQILSAPQRGLNIINGKKVIVK